MERVKAQSLLASRVKQIIRYSAKKTTNKTKSMEEKMIIFKIPDNVNRKPQANWVIGMRNCTWII